MQPPPKKLLDWLRDIIQLKHGDRGIQCDSANGLSFSCLTPTKHLNIARYSDWIGRNGQTAGRHDESYNPCGWRRWWQ